MIRYQFHFRRMADSRRGHDLNSNAGQQVRHFVNSFCSSTDFTLNYIPYKNCNIKTLYFQNY